MTFAERLKELMRERGLSEAALHAKSGVPFGTIHTYTNGRRVPAFEAVIKLAAALGVDCRAFANCTFEYEAKRMAPTPQKPSKKRKSK